MVLAWHTGALSSSTSTTKQKGEEERDEWCSGSLSHGTQLEAASGNLQAVMSPCADQVLPELSFSGGSSTAEGSGRTGLRVQVGLTCIPDDVF